MRPIVSENDYQRDKGNSVVRDSLPCSLFLGPVRTSSQVLHVQFELLSFSTDRREFQTRLAFHWITFMCHRNMERARMQRPW